MIECSKTKTLTINQKMIYVWCNTINLTLPLFIEVPAPNQKSELSYKCYIRVRNIDFPYVYDFSIEFLSCCV